MGQCSSLSSPLYLSLSHNTNALTPRKNKDVYIFIMKCYGYSTSVYIPSLLCRRGCPRGVIVKAMDCEIVVSEFELQSCYYVHFRTVILRKGMNPLILPAMG